MNIGSLVFFGDSKRAWRYQDNDYPPVQEALIYLETNNVGRRFDGALEVTLEELAVFVKHLFWLVRCNAALPIFHFMDSGEHIVGSICQRGNVHISTLSASSETHFQAALDKTDFIAIDHKTCYSTFSKMSKIPNRKTQT